MGNLHFSKLRTADAIRFECPENGVVALKYPLMQGMVRTFSANLGATLDVFISGPLQTHQTLIGLSSWLSQRVIIILANRATAIEVPAAPDIFHAACSAAGKFIDICFGFWASKIASLRALWLPGEVCRRNACRAEDTETESWQV